MEYLGELFNYAFLESVGSLDDVFEDAPEFVRINLSPDGATQDSQPNESEA